jgi:hypothetical protein
MLGRKPDEWLWILVVVVVVVADCQDKWFEVTEDSAPQLVIGQVT